MPTLYDLLEVAPDVDARGLKKAWRAAAMKHHPDRNPDDPAAEARFKAVAEAYEVLKDSRKRSLYDMKMHSVMAYGSVSGLSGADIFSKMWRDFANQMAREHQANVHRQQRRQQRPPPRRGPPGGRGSRCFRIFGLNNMKLSRFLIDLTADVENRKERISRRLPRGLIVSMEPKGADIAVSLSRQHSAPSTVEAQIVGDMIFGKGLFTVVVRETGNPEYPSVIRLAGMDAPPSS